MTHDEIQRPRHERAARWVAAQIVASPAVSIDEETEETLNAEPPRDEKRKKRDEESIVKET